MTTRVLLAGFLALSVMIPVSAPCQPAADPAEQVEFLLFEGELFLEEGRVDEAIKALRQVLVLAPERLEAHLLYARALTSGVFSGIIQEAGTARDEALIHYRWVLEKDPENREAIRGVRLLTATNSTLENPGLTDEEARRAWDAGHLALEQKNFDKAVREFGRAARKEPESAQTHRDLGRALRLAGDEDKAAEAFTRSLELDPADAEAHVGLGEVRESTGSSSAALTHYRRALQLDKFQPEASLGIIRLLGGQAPDTLPVEDLALLGRAYLVTDEYESAGAALRQATETDSSLLNRKMLGIAEFFLRNDETALDLLVGVHQETPEDTEVLYYLGGIQLRLGNIDEGRGYLDRTLELDPENPNALRLLGLSLVDEADQTERAFDLLQRADEAGARIEKLPCILGTLLLRLNHWQESALAFDECVSRHPDFSGAHLGLGVIADNRGHTREAIEHLERYLELQEEPEISAVFRLGVAYLRSGQDEQGFKALRRLIETESGNDEEVTELQLLEMTSYFLSTVRRFEDAIFIGEMLLTRSTDNAVYNNNLAMTYADANQNLGRAKSLSQKANRLDPENPGHLDTLGWTLTRLREFEEAERVLLKAIRLSGEGRDDLSEVYYHLGYLYRVLERHQEANEMLARALENPPTPYLRNEIQRLLDEQPGPRDPR